MNTVDTDNYNVNLSELNNKTTNRTSVLEKEFSFYQKSKDKRYGEISLYKNVNGDIIMMRDKILKTDNELKSLIDNLMMKSKLFHPHIHRFLDVSIFKNSGLCSNNYIIKLFYEYSIKDLKDDIEFKKSEKLEFNNIELTHILYQLGLVNYYLEQNNLNNGDIRPENVYYYNDKGILKLINRLEEKEYYYDKIEMIHKRYFANNLNPYLSPQLFQHIKRPVKGFTYNKNKEDMFALGLLIVSCGLNVETRELYNYKNGTFDEEKLKFWLETFYDKFIKQENQLLATTVENMLIIDEKERPDFHTMFSQMPNYEQIIEHFNQNYENTKIEENPYVTNNINVENKLKTENIVVNNSYNNGSQHINSRIEDKNNSNIKLEIQNNFPPLKPNVTVDLKGIKYLWDNEYKRHYYFDSKINDFEWYYDNEELEILKKQENL